MKIVNKPWGEEQILAENQYYVYKRILIKSGHKTSYQYHERKTETNCIISGDAEVWLENENGIVNKTQEVAGFHFTVLPYKKHRIIAKTDLVLMEVSTAGDYKSDVIRLEDDTDRGNGLIKSEWNEK